MLVTDYDVFEIGQDAFREIFDEVTDTTIRIAGYATEGSFDASDYDTYTLYLDKAGTQPVEQA
jgi:hypothetical protein